MCGTLNNLSLRFVGKSERLAGQRDPRRVLVRRSALGARTRWLGALGAGPLQRFHYRKPAPALSMLHIA